jgi:hypothetical protein
LTKLTTEHEQSLEGLLIILKNFLSHLKPNSTQHSTFTNLYEQLQNPSNNVSDLISQLTSLRQEFLNLADDHSLNKLTKPLSLEYSKRIRFYPPAQADVYELLPKHNLEEKDQTIVKIANDHEEEETSSLLIQIGS